MTADPELLSPRQAAELLGVSEASVKRWCDRGILPAVRTEGGHRRVPTEDVQKMLAERGGRPQNRKPEEVVGAAGEWRDIESISQRLCAANSAGDEAAACMVLRDGVAAGHDLPALLDALLTLHAARLSEDEYRDWMESQSGQTCRDALTLLRREYERTPRTVAPVVLAGLDGDQCPITLHAAALATRASGFKTILLGAGLPFHTLRDAITELNPAVLVLRLACVKMPQAVREHVEQLVKAAHATRSAVVVLGCPSEVGCLATLPVRMCENLTALAQILRVLVPPECEEGE